MSKCCDDFVVDVVLEGPQGRQGPEGRPGATIITGTVPPVPADGKDGDYFIEDRTASGQGRRMWGPKAGGAWPGAPWSIQVASYRDVPGLPAVVETLASKGANSDITSLTGLTTPLSQAQGGLGNGNGDASGLSVTATGGNTARTHAARAADVINVKDFGAKGDGITRTASTTIAAGATALTVSGAAFTAADVGKRIVVPGAGASGLPLASMIASVTSSTQVTLADAAVIALSAKSVPVFYGTDDALAIQAALNTAASRPQRNVKVYVPAAAAGAYLIASPITLPTVPNGVRSGVTISGDGRGTSILKAGAAFAGGILQTPTSYVRGTVISDLTLEGNGLAQHAIWQRAGNDFYIQRVWAFNATRSSIRLDGTGTQVNDVKLDNQDAIFPTVDVLPPYNIETNGPDNNLFGVGCSNASVASYHDTGGSNHFENCYQYNYLATIAAASYGTYGFVLSGGAVVVGCTADSVVTAGFRLAGYGVTVVGSTVKWNTEAGWAASVGFLVDAGQMATVIGNYVSSAAADNIVVASGSLEPCPSGLGRLEGRDVEG